MRKLYLTILCLLALHPAGAQTANLYYEQGLAAIRDQQFETAILQFDSSIRLKRDHYIVWYNRGIVKTWLRRYESAIPDFDEAIRLNPKYKKAWNNRANARQDLTDYEGALADYNMALSIDSEYVHALFNRGELYELLGRYDMACRDFRAAYSLGDSMSRRKVDRCTDTARRLDRIFPLLRLKKMAPDDKYGFTPEQPVKVGSGPQGGPANQRTYLNLLRDRTGRPLEYERISSCCPYESEHGYFGMAMVDKYRITYRDADGKQQTAFVYISFYDYEEPRILSGFKTVRPLP